jgi:glycosyltransferase involved in cell wall biosynthesis
MLNYTLEESAAVARGQKGATLSITPSKPAISIIISARNEFPNIVHTVHSLINALEFDGYGYDPKTGTVDFEIIIVDNGSADQTSMFWGWAKSNETDTKLQKSPRGLAYNNVVKVMYDPVMGNVSARNQGALYARGDYLFFCDAHMSITMGVFGKMIKACNESGGLVHPVVEWMGAYPPKGGFQYSIKVGEKFWGTWNRLAVSTKEWFYIPGSGHCFFCVKRDQFFKFGGYNNYFRVYGGGELYLDLKWWMLGSCSVVVPDAFTYHLSAGRGYNYFGDDLVHNLMLSCYVIAGKKYAERVLLTYINKKDVSHEKYYSLFEQATVEGKDDRDFIENAQVRDFESLIAGNGACDGHCNPRAGAHNMCAWDVKNEERFGKHLSGIMILDDWLGRLETQEAKDFVESRPYLLH